MEDSDLGTGEAIRNGIGLLGWEKGLAVGSIGYGAASDLAGGPGIVVC